MLTLKVILGPVYDTVAEQLESQFQPAGAIEVLLAAQIVRAHWRIERCEKAQDPDHPDIDRLRHRAEISIRRNMAEIRQLQADRHLKAELNLSLPGITRVKDVLSPALSAGKFCSRQDSGRLTHSAPPDDQVAHVETKIAAVMAKEAELQSTNPKIRTQNSAALSPHAFSVPLNSGRCPCGSGQKHKRCCGKGAPPLYNLAA